MNIVLDQAPPAVAPFIGINGIYVITLVILVNLVAKQLDAGAGSLDCWLANFSRCPAYCRALLKGTRRVEGQPIKPGSANTLTGHAMSAAAL
jgi:hypothetical protein